MIAPCCIRVGSSAPIRAEQSLTRGYLLRALSERACSTKMMTNERSRSTVIIEYTMTALQVLYLGVKWRFSQMMSDGSEAS